jgi:hypothetical protein
MRIYTVTHHDRPLAVVRARHPNEAIETAQELAWEEAKLSLPAGDELDARDPNDGEMVGWLERRDDFLLVEAFA